MKTKNLLLVSFCAVFFALALVSTVSAAEITNAYAVTVEGLDAYVNYVSVVAGEDITIKVYFTANVSDTDVTIEAELEGEKVETDSQTEVFDVEAGKAYRQVMTLKVPFELKDEISDDLTLSIEIDGKEHKTVLNDITLRVQRPSYNAVVMSVTVPSYISAGESLPVDIVLKNMGYNNLDDLYVTIKSAELSLAQGPTWFGDLVKIEDCDDDCDKEDTVAGRLYLKVPYEVKAGVYALEVIVYNDDLKTSGVKQFVVKNDYASNVIVTSAQKTVAEGRTAEYKILLVNPTDNVRVYTIIPEVSQDLTVTAEQTVVAVPAGSSKEITITAKAADEGEYNFLVNVLAGESLVSTANLGLSVEGKTLNATVVLTVILAIIFLVLLVVLIVLLGSKKPQKTEDFGESYY